MPIITMLVLSVHACKIIDPLSCKLTVGYVKPTLATDGFYNAISASAICIICSMNIICKPLLK